ncbi:MAG: hypothetical protein HY695_13025 [Deltaproteobacteria bacterium]|nr:hypothetical protein [Deltaproteobacteria bacterium]
MKHLKSSVEDLRDLFETGISVRHIAEPLVSFDSDQPAPAIKQFLTEKDFDVVGVRKDGAVVGYAKIDELADGLLGTHSLQFGSEQVLPASAPLLTALNIVRESTRAFILVLGQVGGIVTKGDFQKAPVRMWLFGLVTLVEMQLLRLIRNHYPNESWKPHISAGRLEKAEQLLSDRRRRNEAIDLADCLQFCDRIDIVFRSERIILRIGLKVPDDKKLLIDLMHLRDELAHSQDIITGRWPALVGLAAGAEEIIRKCEAIRL